MADGSLCWKADFAHESSFVGSVTGWHRRFAQRSTDHRGTPQAPGLVATLLTDEQLAAATGASAPPPGGAASACFGVCYKVGKEDAPAVLDNLDFREKGGYTRGAPRGTRARGRARVQQDPFAPTLRRELLLAAVVDVQPRAGRGPPVRALLYTANPQNPHFFLPGTDEAARIIATAVGPSGPNRDYLVNLGEWITANQLEDPHIEELCRLLPAVP